MYTSQMFSEMGCQDSNPIVVHPDQRERERDVCHSVQLGYPLTTSSYRLNQLIPEHDVLLIFHDDSFKNSIRFEDG
ncbi:unnamed protein product [Camellia sinensis]